MNEQIDFFSPLHIKRFKRFHKIVTSDYQLNNQWKLISTQREIYFIDTLDKLKNNDIVVRKVNDNWQITAKIDSEYGYHHINCQNALEADQILSSLIRQRLHQMNHFFEIETKNYLVKVNNHLEQISVCRLISSNNNNLVVFFKESNNIDSGQQTTSKYQIFSNITEKPKLIRKPSIKLLTRFGSKELIQYESKIIEKQEKLKEFVLRT
jgi:hypothetical protein